MRTSVGKSDGLQAADGKQLLQDGAASGGRDDAFLDQHGGVGQVDGDKFMELLLLALEGGQVVVPEQSRSRWRAQPRFREQHCL